jgi:DNA topoisomerase IB
MRVENGTHRAMDGVPRGASCSATVPVNSHNTLAQSVTMKLKRTSQCPRNLAIHRSAAARWKAIPAPTNECESVVRGEQFAFKQCEQKLCAMLTSATRSCSQHKHPPLANTADQPPRK